MKMQRPTRRLSWLGVAVLAVALPALGEEITVQNDSFTSGGSAVIVGDFVVGEQAGVRLTSPCNGSIVAVQIGWLSYFGGTGYSLEEAIHIYDGSTFPTPGTELETLEGPALTDGALNEFRYLDDQGAIPLNVPVTAGQQFYVTLEFANDTHVGSPNYSASVFRDVSGCQAGKNVLYAIPGGWFNFCTFLQGDLVIRAVIDCPGVTGGCCHADGTCENAVEEADCQEFGDVWHEGLNCGEFTCTARGACCRSGGCLQLVDAATCAAIGGTYAGNGSDCNDDVCVTGACCFADGSCEELFEFDCVDQGGTFHGIGTECDPNPCPQPTGACCFGEVCIAGQTEAQCAGSGGAWGGAGTDCSDNNSNGTPDACEAGCPNPGASGNHCTADIFGGDCIVSIQDLSQLLAHYGMTGATHDDGDIYPPPDGDGTVNLNDLSALLAQYGDDCN